MKRIAFLAVAAFLGWHYAGGIRADIVRWQDRTACAYVQQADVNSGELPRACAR